MTNKLSKPDHYTSLEHKVPAFILPYYSVVMRREMTMQCLLLLLLFCFLLSEESGIHRTLKSKNKEKFENNESKNHKVKHKSKTRQFQTRKERLDAGKDYQYQYYPIFPIGSNNKGKSLQKFHNI